jgi:hypothetical protein
MTLLAAVREGQRRPSAGTSWAENVLYGFLWACVVYRLAISNRFMARMTVIAFQAPGGRSRRAPKTPTLLDVLWVRED